jgi:hypothetical protein
VRDTAKLPWKPRQGRPRKSLSVYGFRLDGKGLFIGTTVGSDTQRVVEKNLKTGSERLEGEEDRRPKPRPRNGSRWCSEAGDEGFHFCARARLWAAR